jgi:hypothetical protein
MSFLLLLLLLAIVAIGIGIGYAAFRSKTGRKTPEEPPKPPGIHREPPRHTAQRKADGES